MGLAHSYWLVAHSSGFPSAFLELLTIQVFATFGYANTFGVFQAYYATGYPNETASNISWVGSVQLFLQFSLGAVVGPLYDRGYFYSLTISGSVVYIVW